MRPANCPEFPEYAPRPERRQPLPITTLPVNTLTTDSDPTLEIRTLIEQLQAAAREARTKAQEAEQERDDIGTQLARALVQIDELRASERELRSNFTEVTTLIRERDQAIATADRNARLATRAQEEVAGIVRQRDEAERQRDAATRQHEEALQRVEGLTRAYSDSGLRSGEVQKQLAAIRQARDNAHSQNAELSERLSTLEDEIAELDYQRESAKKAQKQAETEAGEYRRQLDAASGHRDVAERQVKELTAELDGQRLKLLDLSEQKSAVLQADSEHAVALGEARAQVVSLAQERDAARTLAQERVHELEEIRTQFQSFRENETRAASDELTATREKLTAFEAQARQARHETANFKQLFLAMQEKVATLEALVAEAGAHRKEAELEMAATAQQSDSERAALQTARQQLEEVTRERNDIRTRAEETRLEMEAQIVALRSQSGGPYDPAHNSNEAGLDASELQRRLARQRLQTLELGAQLETAQREIREMSANLAEARLQLKFGGTRGTRSGQPSTATVAPPVAPQPPALPLYNLIAPLCECFDVFAKSPREPALLCELHDHVISYAERARSVNSIAVHRLGQAFAALLAGLAANPDHTTHSTLNTVRQTIALLSSLRDEAALATFKDPACARILVVDDDAGNGLCVQLAMHEQMIQTTCSDDPTRALLDLAETPYDLVLLDVNMPQMDGFQLCQQLRAMPQHAKTPVVFITGLSGEETREMSALSGGNDFLAKPFNVNELTVKALTLLLQAQLPTA